MRCIINKLRSNDKYIGIQRTIILNPNFIFRQVFSHL